MAVTVLIPTPLRNLTADLDTVEVSADTVGALIASLEANYPGMAKSLQGPTGAINRYVNIYVNDEDVRYLEDAETPLKDGDQVSIVPAIAGGSHS